MIFFKAFIILAYISYTLCLEDNLQNGKTFEKCKIAFDQKKFDVLPGRGWDNLNNEIMGQILNYNFSRCQYSQDNIYLIPDSVSITPTKMSEVEMNANTFSHFTNYTTVTSESINAEAHAAFFGASFSGSFSKEKEQVKNDQMKTKSTTVRVQLRYNVFKSLSEPDAELHPTFRNRIMDIAGLVIENKDYLYPEYLADMIVRDYGTHVINSVDAGAALSKIDSINSTYRRKYESNSNTISISAAASFGSLFGMSAKYTNKVSQTQIDEYDQSCERTRIITYGGTLYAANFSLNEWRLSVLNNMVPIDRNGNPIYYVITPRALGELDAFTVNKVYTLLKKAVKRYYSANARRGCLDINALNFNPDANIDGKDCTSPTVMFSFGGVYQTCAGSADQCSPVQQVNPLTGKFSCPKNYESILLHSALNECREYCERYFIFWRRCHNTCSYFKTFWCSPSNFNETNVGYRFGGFIPNQLKTCPLNYFPLKLGSNAKVCVSVNNDPLDENAIKFGGLYSCSVGNPLAREFVNGKKGKLLTQNMMPLQYWPKMCAKGYIAHLASIDQGCELSYCTETNKVSFGALPLLIRPPFISLNYNPNSTKVLVFSTSDGKKIIKSEFGNWETDEVKIKEKKLILGSVFGTFGIVCLISGIIIFLQRRQYKKNIANLEFQQSLLDPSSCNYGSITEDNEAV